MTNPSKEVSSKPVLNIQVNEPTKKDYINQNSTRIALAALATAVAIGALIYFAPAAALAAPLTALTGVSLSTRALVGASCLITALVGGFLTYKILKTPTMGPKVTKALGKDPEEKMPKLETQEASEKEIERTKTVNGNAQTAGLIANVNAVLTGNSSK